MFQSKSNLRQSINFRFLMAPLLAVSASGCGTSALPEADFNASEGRCYSMTPLLETLPQGSQIGSLVEVERGCTFNRVWATYAEDESPNSPYFYISANVLDGQSPFVRDFTLDGTAEISGPIFPKEAYTSEGNSAVESYESCQKLGVELGNARQMQDFHIVTDIAGQSACISTYTFNGKLTGNLRILSKPDIMMNIRYFRELDRQPYDYDADDIAELMLPVAAELNIPNRDWPSPLGKNEEQDSERR